MPKHKTNDMKIRMKPNKQSTRVKKKISLAERSK